MTRTREDLLGPDPEEMEIEEREDIVRRLNRIHAFIAGKGVLREGDDGFQIESVRQFHDWYANKVVWTRSPNGADVAIPYSKIWMASPQRREYQRIVLDPREETEDAYNLWRGFAFAPGGKGSCELFLDHVFDNVCRGDKALYRWFVGWMAHAVQRPWEKPGTAVVLKGAPGVGKTTVGEHLGALMPHHYVTVSTPRGLMGQFNAHLATALLVQVEEGFWAGDKSAESDLRHKITGATFNLERKGQDVIELPSFHRYIITSNERWTVPAQHEERRYAIFDVGADRQKDEAYFGAIAAEMRAGGYRALMRHLMDFDLDRVNVRSIPNTKALGVEKVTSLRGVHAWWHDVLAAGALPGEAWERFSVPANDWSGGRAHRADSRCL
jgi:hypothetical protein